MLLGSGAKLASRRLAASTLDGLRLEVVFGVFPRHGLAGGQYLRPAHFCDGVGDGIEDEDVRRPAFAFGRGGDARLQIVFEADGGHDTADAAE
ncbi:MAG: hypothetical protein ACXWCE_10415 [Caldimonas sp.]